MGFLLVFLGNNRWRFCNKGLLHTDRVMIKLPLVMLIIWRLEKRFRIKIWCSSFTCPLCQSLKLFFVCLFVFNLGHILLSFYFIKILCLYLKQKLSTIIILVVILHFISPANKHLVSVPRSLKSFLKRVCGVSPGITLLLPSPWLKESGDCWKSCLSHRESTRPISSWW